MEINPIEILDFIIHNAWYVQSLTAIILILLIYGMWELFEHFGEKGWLAILPLVNLYVLCKLVFSKAFFSFLLLIIPIVNILFWFILNIRLMKKLNRNIFIGILSVFFPFITYPLYGRLSRYQEIKK